MTGSFARKAWVAAVVVLAIGVAIAAPTPVGAQQAPLPVVDLALDETVADPDPSTSSESAIETDPDAYIELDAEDVLGAVVASSGSPVGEGAWYGPGSEPDSIWWGQTTHAGFAAPHASTRTVGGTYSPTSGDFNGNGYTDVYWFAFA